MNASALIQNAKRIVIKIGSALIADEKSGKVRQDWLNSVADDIAALIKQNKEVIIVSSGAIALGRSALDINYTDRPASIPLDKKQAAAAIGNVEISQAYSHAFAPHDVQTAMVLLSPKDTEDRQSHLNARATLLTLLSHKSVPIINENDTVATAEIRFGDNDRLAARLAQMVEADLLIQLSTTDGLYTADPSQDASAEHIPVVDELSDALMNLAGDAPEGLSTGGMKSKLEAAKIATHAGVTMMIASGKLNNPIDALEVQAKATIFMASSKPVSARKKWIASHVKMAGMIVIDEGAAEALKSGKSLLPAGVVKVSGAFQHGDPIEINNIEGHTLAMGLASYSANEARLIIGHKSGDIADVLGYHRGDEIINRDNLVLQG